MLLDLNEAFVSEGYEKPISYELQMEKNGPGGEFRGPVKVSGRLYNRAGVVCLSLNAVFDYFTVCDRCLKPVTEHRNISLFNTVVKKASGEAGDDMIVAGNEKLDIDELIRSGVILSLPMKHLCKQDCKGLCPVCGKDLNTGECGCTRTSNSAFSSLGDLIK